jgi:two-component system LytT family sensor kinase
MNINDKEILIIIIFILTSVCFMLYIKLKAEKKQCERIAKENRKLIADNALLDAEHLKFQLQPHTLNNILANLKVIASKLNKGIDSLSETLDYILYKGNTHLVSVQEEINFIKKYLALNDLFISEIDSIKLIDSQVNRNSKYFDSACIPHLITAYFIENAFKHGDVNHPDFLKIELKLSATAFEMNVVNRIRQKPIEANGGIGLNNMRKRLDLLLTGKFEIASSSNEQEYYSSLIIHF